MNIKLMLTRLQSAMGREDLIEKMVLLSPDLSISNQNQNKSVNLVVGYNSSPSSQTALDLTLWIAHQTRLATQKQVTVQVVYVLDENQTTNLDSCLNADSNDQLIFQLPLPKLYMSAGVVPVVTQSKQKVIPACQQMMLVNHSYFRAVSHHTQFEQADRILWQARSLAEEWRGSFKAHLRFGDVAEELRKVVEVESATLLFLGCNSVNHPIVQKLNTNFPCSVLGIPTVKE